MSKMCYDSLTKYLWYFDSACSRHMTGSPELLRHLKPGFGGYVKFGDGSKSRVIGKGELVIQGFPIFKDVLLVEGLKANLLSISHLCDCEMTVEFDKRQCRVKHGEGCSQVLGLLTTATC